MPNATGESFNKDVKSGDGLSNTKTSLNPDNSRNVLVQSPSATFITGGAGMQDEHRSEATEAEEGRETKIEENEKEVEPDKLTEGRVTSPVPRLTSPELGSEAVIPEAEKEEGSDDEVKEVAKI